MFRHSILTAACLMGLFFQNQQSHACLHHFETRYIEGIWGVDNQRRMIQPPKDKWAVPKAKELNDLLSQFRKNRSKSSGKFALSTDSDQPQQKLIALKSKKSNFWEEARIPEPKRSKRRKKHKGTYSKHYQRTRFLAYRQDPAPRNLALVQALLVGRFAHHSKRFHRWRIKDRLRKLRKEPKQLKWYDDLAVSYDKLGRQKKAIQVMHKKRKYQKKSYETYANLGTFYIHQAVFKKRTKSFPKGLRLLKKAVKMNPDAHFGREIYQILLVEYIMQQKRSSRRQKAPKFALGDGFAKYVLAQKNKERSFVAQQHFPQQSYALRDAAIRGILGMMRFGHYRSPVLLAALGSLLSKEYGPQGKRMAARAFLKASYETRSRKQRRLLKRRARALLFSQNDLSSWKRHLDWRAFEQNFRKEIRVGQVFSQHIRKNERKWLRTKQDPELTFAKTYLANANSATGRLLLLSNKAFSKLLREVTCKHQKSKDCYNPYQMKKKQFKKLIPVKKEVTSTYSAAPPVARPKPSMPWGFLWPILLFICLSPVFIFYYRYRYTQRQRWDSLFQDD